MFVNYPAQKLLLLAVPLLALACTDRTPLEPAEQTVRPARIFQVENSSKVLEYKFVGRVEALQTIDVSFEVSGPLVDLPIREGQSVVKGELLAQLDSTDFKLAVREAQVQTKLARHDLERKREVLKRKGIARSVVDDAESQYELQLVRLDQAKERLAESKISAPFEAVIARRFVDNHVNIRAGEPVLRLHDLTQLLVTANVPEILLATANQDHVQNMYAEFDFAPGQQFALEIHENRGEADAVAQTYEVTLSMANPATLNVLPGMTGSVHVKFLDPSATQTVHIPANALVSNAEGDFFVWRYNSEDNSVERQMVTVGTPELAGVPVLSGLSGGENIVATGAEHLQTGMKVRPLLSVAQ